MIYTHVLKVAACGKPSTQHCFCQLIEVTFHLTTVEFLEGAGLVKLDPVINKHQIS
jgi:hypothetical protein